MSSDDGRAALFRFGKQSRQLVARFFRAFLVQFGHAILYRLYGIWSTSIPQLALEHRAQRALVRHAAHQHRRFVVRARLAAAEGDLPSALSGLEEAQLVAIECGLDRLRANGWRGSGYVRWEHEANRGFLRALAGLQACAAQIGEDDEADRCATFLRQLDPAWPPPDLAGDGAP